MQSFPSAQWQSGGVVAPPAGRGVLVRSRGGLCDVNRLGPAALRPLFAHRYWAKRLHRGLDLRQIRTGPVPSP